MWCADPEGVALHHPKVHFVVKSLPSLDQVEALRGGRIDVGFVALPRFRVKGWHGTHPPRAAWSPSANGPPFPGARTRSSRALSNETLIPVSAPPQPGTLRCHHSIVPWHGHEPARGQRGGRRFHTMLELISADFGVSLMRVSVQNVPMRA